jgi:uncharacterized protein (TIGR03083 family)
MTLSLHRSLEAISGNSHALAEAARGNLGARVEHCPEWSVADLVRHVTEVHWFWRTIAAGPLQAPPDESARPARMPDEELVDELLSGATALVDALGSADQSAGCWTWFPPQQDVAFITRHQIQEAAVHAWDAVHAAGQELDLDVDVAVDSIEEFLTCSLADAEDVERIGVLLDGELVLHATDTDQTWTVAQATPRAALTWSASTGEEGSTVSGTASDLLLWLYGRVDLPTGDPEVVARFRRLSSTD